MNATNNNVLITIKTLIKSFILCAGLLASMTSIADEKAILVKLQTNMGDIVIQLNKEKAPLSVQNFLNYVRAGTYNGTIFHRVIDGFMIQGGGFKEDMSKQPTQQPIQNEANNGLKNDKGTVAMARTSAPHSATSQFFINVVDNDFLNFRSATARGWGYAVFGKVVQGMDTVDKIKKVKTQNISGYQNVPVTPVIITNATILETPSAP